MLDAYDATYTALTLTPRQLSEHAKEFVWLVVLTTTREAIATHHIKRFRDGGGTDAELELAVRLAAYGEGAGAFSFVDAEWSDFMPAYGAETGYRAGLDRLTDGSGVPEGWVEMALAAAHACRRAWTPLRWHIAGAYAAGVEETALAEALTLMMFPGGVPNFVDACHHWRELILDGTIEPSPAFRAWAETPGQGGYTEAAKGG